MKSAASRALVFSCLIIACGPSARDPGGGDDTNTGPDADTTTTPRQCNKMDLVFVVDDSGSMQEEQSNLATNFPMFASLLSSYVTPNGEKIDYRIAVTTTGKDIMYTVQNGPITLPMNEDGDNGAFRNNCNMTKRFLEPTDANMQQVLSCRANVGTSGPGFEMPLLMTKWALGERVADNTNAGFLRDDALLGVVILTDEDDASTTQNNFTVTVTSQPPVDYQPADLVAFLDTLKGHRTRWAAGVIAGETDCSSSFGMAAKATRLQDFVTQANTSSTQASFSSICDGNLTAALQKTLDTFQAACGVVIF
jgi:hypothetical protein